MLTSLSLTPTLSPAHQAIQQLWCYPHRVYNFAALEYRVYKRYVQHAHPRGIYQRPGELPSNHPIAPRLIPSVSVFPGLNQLTPSVFVPSCVDKDSSPEVTQRPPDFGLGRKWRPCFGSFLHENTLLTMIWQVLSISRSCLTRKGDRCLDTSAVLASTYNQDSDTSLTLPTHSLAQSLVVSWRLFFPCHIFFIDTAHKKLGPSSVLWYRQLETP